MSLTKGWLPSRQAVVLGLLSAALLVPLIVPPNYFFPYVVPRSIFFRVVVEVAAFLSFLSWNFDRRKLGLAHDPIFRALIAFVVAYGVSGMMSPAPTHSFFGDFERMGGVLAWVHLVLWFVLLRTLRPKDWTILLNTGLVVCIFVSLSAIRQHYDLARPGDFLANTASSATIGNSGLLAGYLLFGVAFAVFMGVTQSRYRALYFLFAGIALIALAYAENRSTIGGLLFAGITAWIVYAVLSTKSLRWRRRSVIAGTFCAALIMVAVVSMGSRYGPINRNGPKILKRLASTSFTGADRSRTIHWHASLEGFKDRPLFGYGPENYNLVWSAHFDPMIYDLKITDVFDRAHNQFLETLATTGVVGFVAFLSIWIAIGHSTYRAWRVGRLTTGGASVISAMQVWYGFYLFFWFFDLNATMLWILSAALVSSRATPEIVVDQLNPIDMTKGVLRAPLVVGLAGFLIAISLLDSYASLRTNAALSQISFPRAGLEETLRQFQRVAKLNGQQKAHTPFVMAEFLESLRPDLDTLRKNADQRRLLDDAFAISMSEFENAIHRDTLNDRLYTREGEFLLYAAHVYSSLRYREHGVLALRRAIELSPYRIKQRLVLADSYMEHQEYQDAELVFLDALKSNPRLGEPRYELAKLYFRTASYDSALSMLEGSLQHGYVGEPDVYLAVGKSIERRGSTAAAARLYVAYIEQKYPLNSGGRSCASGKIPVGSRTDQFIALRACTLATRDPWRAAAVGCGSCSPAMG